MSPEAVAALFTRGDGGRLFARRGRPIAPVVLGVTFETLAIVMGAAEAVVALARTPDGTPVLRPGIAPVIRAGYDPVMADDPAHAPGSAAWMGACSEADVEGIR